VQGAEAGNSLVFEITVLYPRGFELDTMKKLQGIRKS
jgi:hypothetical protein